MSDVDIQDTPGDDTGPGRACAPPALHLLRHILRFTWLYLHAGRPGVPTLQDGLRSIWRARCAEDLERRARALALRLSYAGRVCLHRSLVRRISFLLHRPGVRREARIFIAQRAVIDEEEFLVEREMYRDWILEAETHAEACRRACTAFDELEMAQEEALEGWR